MEKKTKKSPNFFLCVILTAIALSVLIYSYTKVQKTLFPREYSDIVEKYSAEYDVDKYLVYSVIKCESSFNPDAVSDIGAMGLMQITPDTFDWLKSKTTEKLDKQTLYNPEINIKYGTLLLSLNLKDFGNEKEAIAAYHAGRGIVTKWLQNDEYSKNGKTLDSIPYKDTSLYVKRVISTYETYTNLYYKETE